MTFENELTKPQSKKITLIEIDTPLDFYKWINYQSGIWFTRITPGSQDFEDDNGNFAYWDTRNDEYYNIQSLNVDGELYGEVASLALLLTTNKSWYYDTATTDMYIHFEDKKSPWEFSRIAPGAAIGFTKEEDKTVNNYFEDIYYLPLVQSVPSLSKKKDALFFGILQFQGGSITFDNTSGEFDSFAQQDLYGQPIRIKLSFEGLPFEDAQTVYTAKIEDFDHTFNSFTVNVQDIRKTLSRSLPVNSLSLTDYPNMPSRLDGTPIPIAFGEILKGEAYRVTNTTTNTFVFCDVEFNAVDSGITVYDKDGAAVSHSGTGTNGTFTSSSTEERLYVDFSVSFVTNGLDIIEDVLGNYESIDFNQTNYDTQEWGEEKVNVRNSGIWIGKGSIKTTADVIEQICIDNNGIFDVLADGKFTFRTFNADRIPSHEIFEDEVMGFPSAVYESEELLSEITINFSKDLLDKSTESYINKKLESEIQGIYRQYIAPPQPINSTLTTRAEAETLSDNIMAQSKRIFPTIDLSTKTQNVALRVLDNALCQYKRRNGNSIIPRSKYQVLGVDIDLSNYMISVTMKQIEEDNNNYYVIDGGNATTDYNFYDGGDSTGSGPAIISGGGA